MVYLRYVLTNVNITRVTTLQLTGVAPSFVSFSAEQREEHRLRFFLPSPPVKTVILS